MPSIRAHNGPDRGWFDETTLQGGTSRPSDRAHRWARHSRTGRGHHRRRTRRNRHPNVGLILFYDATGRFRCSATLVTPTVLMTAAHCTFETLGKTLVTFDSVIAEQAPSPFPVAADPAEGYTSAEIEAAGYLAGTAMTHPNYSNFTDLDNWNDVGVVVLDRPVSGITPARLAPANYLNALGQPVLNKTIFDLVGYGTEVRKPEEGAQKPTPMSYPLIRRVTHVQPGQKLDGRRSCRSTATSTTTAAPVAPASVTLAVLRSRTVTSWQTQATATPTTVATSAGTSASTSR